MEREIPIEEIVVDMPVSEALVSRKMKMLEKDGLVQPLTIWQHGMLVIDGFHRLEAARRLGWQTVRCSVVDVTEEQFWTARIDSAKQHHEVERPRLLAWIRQCWQASDYGKTVDVAEFLWDVRKQLDSALDFNKTRRGKLHLTQSTQDVLAWFDNHAERWNLSSYDIFDAVMGEFVNSKDGRSSDAVMKMAAEKNLSLSEAKQLASEVGGFWIGDRSNEVPPAVLEQFIERGMPPGKFRDEAIDLFQSEREKIRKMRANSERIRKSAPSSVQECVSRCETMQAWMTLEAKSLAASGEAARILAKHMMFLVEFSSKCWPNMESIVRAAEDLREAARRQEAVFGLLPDVVVVHSEA